MYTEAQAYICALAQIYGKSRAETKFILAMPRPGRICERKLKLAKVESNENLFTLPRLMLGANEIKRRP